MINKNEYPLVSIGIPTYNRNYGIKRTLDSIWEQQYPNIEVIISDNCSTDNTQEVIQSFCENHPQISYYRQKSNIGMIPNFMFTLRKAQGKYFMWVADDDKLEPGIIEKYVEFLESHPDYSLVSGEIKYWYANKDTHFYERGFTFEQGSSWIRAAGYYFKVVHGGMIHGMMKRSLTENITLRNVIGNDYHFIANLAYLGKIKNFDFVGYNKNFGGTSRSFKQYAKAMGDSEFAGNFPHLKMACDAFLEVMQNSKIFLAMPAVPKLTLAVSSFTGIFLGYYAKIFPLTIGGKIKRLIKRPFN
ncbi:glycosyltransferase family A protein [Chryseolinea sp. H1M3-3]|uniref:glycosyltransferase family 2 protein n=1 Tax=Chryseolinea sp. H1M3-3 TaxID=3034144 RepID=UPI0023EAB822|nr:glycosyltransferase family A protein [Chryseolinea sp. H1M3-3]